MHYAYQWYVVAILPSGDFEVKQIFLVAFNFRQVRRSQVEKRHCSGDGPILRSYDSHDHRASSS